jgi:hypothetical protein
MCADGWPGALSGRAHAAAQVALAYRLDLHESWQRDIVSHPLSRCWMVNRGAFLAGIAPVHF